MIRPDTWSITKSKIFPLKVADKEYINIWINQCKYQGSIMVAPDKKTLKKSVKSMFFMVQTRCEVETIKY